MMPAPTGVSVVSVSPVAMFQLYPNNEQEWRRAIARWLISGFILLQVVVWIVVPNVCSGRASPRMRQAIKAHQSGPVAELHAAMAAAGELDFAEARRWTLAKTTFFIGLDITLIYLFWNDGTRKSAA